MASNSSKNVLSTVPIQNDEISDPIAEYLDSQQTSIGTALRSIIVNHYSQKYDISGLQQGLVLRVISDPKKFQYSQKSEIEGLNNKNNQERFKVFVVGKAGSITSIPKDVNDPAIDLLDDYTKSPSFVGVLGVGSIVFVDLKHKQIQYTYDKSIGKSATSYESQNFSNSDANGANDPSNAKEAFVSPSNIPDIPASVRKPVSNNVTVSPRTGIAIRPSIISDSSIKDPETYLKTIDQFSVENNPRYKPNRDSWSHIFAWDVSMAMGCKIYPKYYSKINQRIKNNLTSDMVDLTEGQPINNNFTPKLEFPPDCNPIIDTNANQVAFWFKKYSVKFGWKILGGAEEAQKVANEGRLVLGGWENINKKLSTGIYNGPGHVIIIRPDVNRYDPNRGPRIAQAGAKNIADGYFIMGAGTLQMMNQYIYITPVI